MAKTGFFYIGPVDKVECFFCGLQIDEWERRDNAVTEHRKWMPFCPVLERQEALSIPIEPTAELDQLLPPLSYGGGPCLIDICPGSYAKGLLSTPSSLSPSGRPSPSMAYGSRKEYAIETIRLSSLRRRSPPGKVSPSKYAQGTYGYKQVGQNKYSDKAVRLCSFNSWPKALKQKPQHINDAGLFYTGLGDIVDCFSCNGGLLDWEEHCDPWQQHAIWFRKCKYLNLMKSKEYIDAAF